MTPTFPAIGQRAPADAVDELIAPVRRQILLMPLGTWGDVLPFVQLGRELARRGHQVTLAACEVFAPLAEREGFEFRQVLDRSQYEQIWADPQLWHPRMASVTFIREAVLPFMQPQYEIAANAIAAGTCDVLVAPAQSLGARIAEEKHGIPLATVHLAPYLFRSALKTRRVSGISLPEWLPPVWKRAVFRFADFCGDQVFGRSVNRLRTELGLPRAKRVFWEWWNSPERIIALFPDWYAEPQADWPQQSVLAGFLPVDWDQSPPLCEEVDDFLSAGPAPILFTAGTAMAHGGQFFAESVKTARSLGMRAILLSQYQDQLPDDLSSDVLALDFVPLAKLLRRVAAIVHHGGIGTTAQALAAGVPQLVVPMSFDQPDNAYRVECLGVGRSLRRRDYAAATVVPILKQLLTDQQTERRCREVAADFAGSGALHIACDAIEQLVQVPASSASNGGQENRTSPRKPR